MVGKRPNATKARLAFEGAAEANETALRIAKQYEKGSVKMNFVLGCATHEQNFREIEKFITRQPKNDGDSENSSNSDGLPIYTRFKIKATVRIMFLKLIITKVCVFWICMLWIFIKCKKIQSNLQQFFASCWAVAVCRLQHFFASCWPVAVYSM